jgi:hypothetical protein
MFFVFKDIEAWDSNKDSVSFPAIADGKNITCAISREALQDNFGGASSALIECFQANRPAIRKKASDLIQ